MVVVVVVVVYLDVVVIVVVMTCRGRRLLVADTQLYKRLYPSVCRCFQRSGCDDRVEKCEIAHF